MARDGAPGVESAKHRAADLDSLQLELAQHRVRLTLRIHHEERRLRERAVAARDGNGLVRRLRRVPRTERAQREPRPTPTVMVIANASSTSAPSPELSRVVTIPPMTRAVHITGASNFASSAETRFTTSARQASPRATAARPVRRALERADRAVEHLDRARHAQTRQRLGRSRDECAELALVRLSRRHDGVIHGGRQIPAACHRAQLLGRSGAVARVDERNAPEATVNRTEDAHRLRLLRNHRRRRERRREAILEAINAEVPEPTVGVATVVAPVVGRAFQADLNITVNADLALAQLLALADVHRPSAHQGRARGLEARNFGPARRPAPSNWSTVPSS